MSRVIESVRFRLARHGMRPVTVRRRREYHLPRWAEELNEIANVDGADYQAIADELGVSRARVQQLVVSGLRKLERGLKKAGLTVEDVFG